MGELRKLLVFLLDDDEDLRTMLGSVLEMSGRCTVRPMTSLREMERHLADLPQLSAAILDINLGLNEPTGIDAYRWLRSHGFAGRVIFLTGHAREHAIVQEADLIGDAILLEKPTEIFQIESAIFDAA
jgi:FixJ family two-component response regulator